MADLFRADAIRKLRDPQQLDTVVKLTAPSSWLALLSLAVIVAAVIVWGFVGELSYRVNGLGVLLRAKSAVFALDAPAAGTIASIPVSVGERVKKDQVLAILNLPELEARLSAARQRLNALTTQRKLQDKFAKQMISERRSNTDEQINAQKAKLTSLQGRLDYLKSLESEEVDELKKRLITRDQLENTRDQISQTNESIDQSRVEIAKLRTDQAEFENQQHKSITDIDSQIIAAEAELSEAQAQTETEVTVNSPVDGKVAEIDASIGVRVAPGQQLMSVEQTGVGLILHAYLPISKGKQVDPGMKVQVTPTFVERDIYGSIQGKVISVSSLPVTRAELEARFANTELVDSLLSGGAPLELLIELTKDDKTPSGLKWSSSKGPPVRITPGAEAQVAVTTRDVHPVDLIVPLAQTWLGLDSGN